LTTSGILSPAWPKLAFLTAQTGSGIPLDLFGSGFTYSPRSIAFPESEPPGTLGLWLRVTGAPPDRVASAEAELVRLIEGLHSGTNGLQAFVARWAWAPRRSVDSSPYELACGVHGQTTTTRAWCTRFLRAVTPRLWLGPEILSHVDKDALGRVADLTASGSGLRLTLRASSSLAQLEEALAPVLPGKADWETAVRPMSREMPRSE
jgi:hypothetical protein